MLARIQEGSALPDAVPPRSTPAGDRPRRGFSAVDVLNAIQSDRGLIEVRDLPYGSDPRQRLDVYAPKQTVPAAPTVVFFYGGSWNSGERGLYTFVGRSLANAGFVTLIPDYRLFPQVRWPDFLRDSAAATAWAKDRAAGFGGDPGRLFLVGHSAGAYNAVSLAVDPRWLAGAGLSKQDLRGAVGIAGPYDFLPLHSDELKTIFGPETQRPDTQPINHVDGGEPPMLLMAPRHDPVVDPGNSLRMAKRLQSAGAKARAEVIPRVSHATSIGVFSPALRFLAPIFSRTAAFIREHAA
jgi:acetyl esterase/lipase